MKSIITTLIVFICSLSCYAQYDMGDTELNTSLTTIIDKAKVHFSEFKTFINLNYGIAREKYDVWQNDFGMNIGDIYLAVEIAKVSRKSADDVATSYKKNKKQGWATIAKEFGVTPGTDAFEVLKGHAYQKAYGKPRPVTKAKPKTKTAPAKKTKSKSTTKPKN